MRQVWLLRVARFIDKTNVTEIFEEAPDLEPTIGPRSTSISLLHVGRLLATKYFFTPEATKKNRKLWDSVKALSDHYRSLLAQTLSIETLRKELEEAEAKRVDMLTSLDDQISKVALTYTTLQNPAYRPEMIINRPDGVDSTMSQAIMMNCKLVRYIFCTDTILDRDDPVMADITKQSLELNDDVALEEVVQVSPQRESRTKVGTSHQHSPTRMDAERSMRD